MTTDMQDGNPHTGTQRWPASAASARLHFVSGKGGTGKTTVAASLALALAAEGKKVLLIECEGRQGIAQLFDIPPLPPTETKVATAEGGGQVSALALDIEHALLEYLDMFYNLGFAGRAMKRIGAIEFATTIAPGLRDVLITGKIKECVVRTERKSNQRVYDAVVVDAPPTGRIGSFLDVTQAMADLTKSGPIRKQSDGVISLLRSDQTAVHLVTLLEAMPIQETLEAVDELESLNLPVGCIFVNRVEPKHLSDAKRAEFLDDGIDRAALRKTLESTGLTISDADLTGLITEGTERAQRVVTQQAAQADLDAANKAQIEIPAFDDGVDLGGLYEIAEVFHEAGI